MDSRSSLSPPFPLENLYFLRAKENISNKKKLQPTSKKNKKNNQKKKQQLNSKNPHIFQVSTPATRPLRVGTASGTPAPPMLGHRPAERPPTFPAAAAPPPRRAGARPRRPPPNGPVTNGQPRETNHGLVEASENVHKNKNNCQNHARVVSFLGGLTPFLRV